MTRTVTALPLALLLSATAAAGPVQLRLETRVMTPPGHDWLARSLSAVSPDGVIAVDPAAPAVVSLLRINPPTLPSDSPGNPFQGHATYYQSDYFTLGVRLTDVATGASAELTYGGRLHADYTYAGHDTWTPSAYVWLDAAALNTTLGGNLYTITPHDGRSAGVNDPGLFDVWVGGNAPAPLPEPGTLALAALGIAPVVTWIRRRQ